MGVFALILATGCAAGTPARPPDDRGDLGARAAAVLAEAIRLKTVNPPGDEAPLAAYLVGIARGAGLEAELVPTPAGESRVGRAAGWARLRGSGSDDPIVLLSHLDTVPAEPSQWTHDPFAGVRSGGDVVGRGAQDAKGVAVVQLFALLELAQREQPLARDVIWLATPDEENGGRDGAGILVRERPDLLGGATLLLTEGGGVAAVPGQPSAWHVAVTEKSPCWLRVVAEGAPGHSSVPPADAAVPRLLAALERVRSLERPVRVVPEVARMFAALAPLAPADDAAGFANLEAALGEDDGFRSRFLAQPRYAALVRDTLTVTVLEGASRTNVLPDRAVAHLDARLLPGSSCEAFAGRVAARAAGPGMRVELLLAFPSSASPIDTPLWRALAEVAARTEPGAILVPRVLAGFTDAHYFREAGLVAYGFVPRWHHQGEPRGVHSPNERISVRNLERGIRTLVTLLEHLDNSTNGDVVEQLFNNVPGVEWRR